MEIFSQKELMALSDGIVALIHNVAEAEKLVNDQTILHLMRDHITDLQALNHKICMMMEE